MNGRITDRFDPTAALDASMRNLQEIHREQAKRNNPAGEMYKKIALRMKRFQAELDDNSELGVQIFGASPFSVRSFTYVNPDILIFAGVNSAGEAVEAIQHHSQLNIVFVAVRRFSEQAFRIGFVQPLTSE